MLEKLRMETIRTAFTRIVTCDRLQSCRASFPGLSRDYTPQPGFVGSRYAVHRVVLLAQNPGHASQAGHVPGETEMYRRLAAAAASSSKPDFDAAMTQLGQFMSTWPVIQRLKLRERFNLDLQDVAYFNLLKCKTVANKKPTLQLYETCAHQTSVPQLEALAPRFVLCLGKGVYDAAQKYLTKLQVSSEWIYHPSGQHYFPDEQKERVAAAAVHMRRVLGSGGPSA